MVGIRGLSSKFKFNAKKQFSRAVVINLKQFRSLLLLLPSLLLNNLKSTLAIVPIKATPMSRPSYPSSKGASLPCPVERIHADYTSSELDLLHHPSAACDGSLHKHQS